MREGGQANLTRTLALEVAAKRITVIAIVPGITVLATPWFDGHYAVNVPAGFVLATGALTVATRLEVKRHKSTGCVGTATMVD